MTTNILDVAWTEINALGGTPCCAHDHVYNAAIRDALRIIEQLGGRDKIARFTPPGEDVLPERPSDFARKPLSERVAITGRYMTVKDDANRVIPLARLDAIQGGDGPDEAA